MATRYQQECDCGWQSDACGTSRDAGALGRRHANRCGDTITDWVQMAQAVVSREFRMPPHLYEEAVAEAALAGWRASCRWDPARSTLQGWVWTAMRNGVIDWTRQRLGRKGQKGCVAIPDSLDAPIDEAGRWTLGDILESACDGFAQIEREIQLRQMIARAHLTWQESEWVATFLADCPQRTLMDGWGVTEGRITQVKTSALRKLRAVA